jgi:hypothetical protein
MAGFMLIAVYLLITFLRFKDKDTLILLKLDEIKKLASGQEMKEAVKNGLSSLLGMNPKQVRNRLLRPDPRFVDRDPGWLLHERASL